ncbi:MAG TPA: hypothetical protein VFJ00_02270 [Candidatus Limnocylindria bacterium]|nr:hypothetical protein [Candidatus Limnocylindria bacterium]
MLDVLLLFPRELDVTEVDGLLARHLVPEFTRASGLRSLRLSEGTVMSRGGPSPYSRVLEASFGSIAEWMAVVDSLNAMGQPADRETLARLAPLVVFFDVTEPRTPI